MTVEELATVCHEANRAYCATLGDHSHKPFAEAEDWQRKTVIEGVRFHLDNPEATPAASHASWLEAKTAAGWQYGPEKCSMAKTHPCCVPYDELPRAQQVKDELFVAIVGVLRRLVATR